MRKRELDDTERFRKQPTYWSQHDQARLLLGDMSHSKPLQKAK